MAQPCQKKWLQWTSDFPDVQTLGRSEGHPFPTNQEPLACGRSPQKSKGHKPQRRIKRGVMKQSSTLTSNIPQVLLNGVGMTDTPHWKLFTWDGPCVTFHNSTAVLKTMNERREKRPFLPLLSSSFRRRLPWTAKPRRWRGQRFPSPDRHILSDLSTSQGSATSVLVPTRPPQRTPSLHCSLVLSLDKFPSFLQKTLQELMSF